MTADALALLFRRLVLAAQEVGAVSRPIEVHEILDALVPYRAARRDGLLDSNDDYLHAVMQLLAGERGYLFGDDLMQDDLKSELSAVNPDLSVLTTYRNAKVRIASTMAEQVLKGDTSIDLRPATPVAAPIAAPAPAPAPAPARDSAAVARTSAPAPRPSATPTAPRGVSRASAEIAEQPAPLVVPAAPVVESVTAVCPYCSKDITTDRPLKYCPHCGINLRIRRCSGCSAEMEAEWKFCVTCGRSAA